ncbi:sphingosine-1-phosphate phosphatase 2 isoform X3 [Epinephelus fuscoguttatus]|uniref:sphingosine-1-phosphate phosphatase 2 isoform X3 n=1 Tax=Epinephelus fuscoguttatus TaxID=293821 RepID=UPI0020D17F85|nr:sphingosine-1-phosphate phosphatase 2 isoform X3 [Epinephelus fuscoguttatus]
MLELLAYLHDSELVAQFQRRCGLFLVDAAHHSKERTRAPAGTPVHAEEPRGQLKGRWDHQDKNSNYQYKQNGGCSRPQYEVRNHLLHFLFLLSAGLGHEIFYITCLPCIHWNLDPFLCRRLINMWTFQFEVGLLIALTLSSLVCLSRLYTGMHSVLDVICGALISAIILFLTYPYWETFDNFQLRSSISPVVALSLLLFLSYTYPELDHYSPTRGDTTTILGVGAGCSVGYWVNEQLGETFEPKGVLPVPLPTLTLTVLALGAARFVVGVVALVGTRQVVKTLSLQVLYAWYRVPKSDDSARRKREIEVPYKFVTYTAVGLVNSILVNRVFILLGIL